MTEPDGSGMRQIMRELDEMYEALADAATVYDDGGITLADTGPTIELLHLGLLATLTTLQSLALQVSELTATARHPLTDTDAHATSHHDFAARPRLTARPSEPRTERPGRIGRHAVPDL